MTANRNRKGRNADPSRSPKGRVSEKKTVARRNASAPGRLSVPGLTYVEDRGAVYNAPIEVVWDFMLKDETFHPKAHTADVRNFEGKEISEVTTLLSYEERRDGRWQKRLCRMTTVRPAVRVQEDLLGPYAGSKTIFLYTPRGDRTVVDVFGFAQSSEHTPAEIKRDRKKIWANAYSEDLPYFRRFVKQHPSGQQKRS